MNIFVITQARMSSTRLPGKIMLKILNKPLLVLFLERLQMMKTIDGVIVATTVGKEDDIVVDTVSNFSDDINIFRGDRDDVLDRYYQSAKKFGAEIIVRITSDCPLMDPEVSDQVVQEFLKGNSDYCCNNFLPRTYPHGLDTEVFSFSALERAWKEAKAQPEREHVTPFIRNNPDIFKLKGIHGKEDLSNHRWTVDYPEDFEFVKEIYERLYSKKKTFNLNDILTLVSKNPNLSNINKNRK